MNERIKEMFMNVGSYRKEKVAKEMHATKVPAMRHLAIYKLLQKMFKAFNVQL